MEVPTDITWIRPDNGTVPYGYDSTGQWWIEDRRNDPTGPFKDESEARDAAEMAAMLIRTAEVTRMQPMKLHWYRGVCIQRAGHVYIVWLDFVTHPFYQPQCASLDGCRDLIDANRG